MKPKSLFLGLIVFAVLLAVLSVMIFSQPTTSGVAQNATYVNFSEAVNLSAAGIPEGWEYNYRNTSSSITGNWTGLFMNFSSDGEPSFYFLCRNTSNIIAVMNSSFVNTVNYTFPAGVTGADACTSNTSTGPVTDWWILNATTHMSIHLNALASAFSSTAGNFTINSLNSGYLRGIAVNGSAAVQTFAIVTQNRSLIHLLDENGTSLRNISLALPTINIEGLSSNATTGAFTLFALAAGSDQGIYVVNPSGTTIWIINSAALNNENTDDIRLFGSTNYTSHAYALSEVALSVRSSHNRLLRNVFLESNESGLVRNISNAYSQTGWLQYRNATTTTDYIFINASVPCNTGVRWRLFYNDTFNGQVATASNDFYFLPRVNSSGGGAVSISSVACDNINAINLTTSGTGNFNVSIDIPFFATGGNQTCGYNVSGAGTVDATNTSSYCQLAINNTNVSSGLIINVSSSASYTTVRRGNLPEAIIASAVVGILVIYVVTQRFKRRGW